MFIGSEGVLGIITRSVDARAGEADHSRRRQPALSRISSPPRARCGRCRQAGLYPSNCRILDPQEAYNTGAGDGTSAIMALAFESADHPLDAWMARALECCADHGGAPEAERVADGIVASSWRTAFIRMPYAREFLTPAALIIDTFETAITWDRFEALHGAVMAATERAIRAATGGRGR